MNLALQIKRARKSAGLTQTQLAEIVGSTQGRIADWENERRSMTIETLEQLADALGAEFTIGDKPMQGRLLHQLYAHLMDAEMFAHHCTNFVADLDNDLGSLHIINLARAQVIDWHKFYRTGPFSEQRRNAVNGGVDRFGKPFSEEHRAAMLRGLIDEVSKIAQAAAVVYQEYAKIEPEDAAELLEFSNSLRFE